MEHDEFEHLLTAYVLGELCEERAQEVRAHLEVCRSCTRAVETLRGVERQLREFGPALLEDHPESVELAAYVAASDELAPDRRAEIAAHVRGCPTCNVEVDVSEQALHMPAGWVHRLRRAAGAFRPAVRSPVLAWVPTAVALLLLYPAYVGLFGRGPEAPTPESTPVWAASQSATGTVGVALLPPPRRDGSEPRVVLDRDQDYQVIIAHYDPAPDDLVLTAAPVRLELSRAGEAEPIWTRTGPANQLWSDAVDGFLLLMDSRLVPADSYRLQMQALSDSGPLHYELGFQVR